MGAPDVDEHVINEAEALLESPDLLPRVESFIEDSGLVGEEVNRRLILLAGVGGRLGHPIHIIVKGPSSGGKNNLVNTALSPLPSDTVTRAAHVSEKALAYSGSLDGVLLVEEAEGQQAAEYAIRIAMSEGQVGNLTVSPNEDGVYEKREMVADVTASIVTTTTETALHRENQTRVFDVEIDASRELTGKVLENEAARWMGEVQEPDEHEKTVVRTATEMLGEEVKRVRIPFADALVPYFPTGAVRARRDLPRVFYLIQASTLLHQRQRKRDADGHLLASVEDYRAVYPVLEEVLEQSMTGLTQTARDLCRLHDELAEETDSGWVRRPDLERLADERDVASQNTVHKWCKRLSSPELGIWAGKQIPPLDTWAHMKIRDPETGRVNLPAPEELEES